MMRNTPNAWTVGMAALALASSCRSTGANTPNTAPQDPTPKVEREDPKEPDAQQSEFSLRKLRASFETAVAMESDRTPAPEPPPETFSKVSFKGPLGDYVAYVTPERRGEKRPAIVWIPGGFDWGIGSWLWEPAARSDDQRAAAFREAGIVLMVPALRGCNENPGHAECFGGEVEDVIAAADYLASRPDIDPERIYLGGHSTGGTMVLLVAETTARFRAVFSFGAVSHPIVYGAAGCLNLELPADELEARSVARFLSEIVTPTFIIEGSYGNSDVLPLFEKLRGKAPITVIEVPGADHFSVLAPASEFIAKRILEDKSEAVNLQIDGRGLAAAFSG